MPDDWLNISEVSKILGVHPSTVRSWSDQGQFPAHRTQGGHRRFLRSEVELWMQSQRSDAPNESQQVVHNALKRTRLQVSEGRLEDETWYQKLNGDAREHYRYSGRTLLQGLLEYLSAKEGASNAEPRSIGYEYASLGWRYGLTYTEATRALLFFRSVLLEAMLATYESASVQSPAAWSDMYRKVNAFTDQIQITLLETYASYEKGSHR